MHRSALHIRLLSVGLAAVLVGGAFGCSPSAETEGGQPSNPSRPASNPGRPAQIMLVTNNASAFWSSMGKGLADAAAEMKVQADYREPPDGEVAEQKQLMEDSVDRGCDSLGVSAIDPSTITPTIDSIAERGVNVLTFDSDAPHSRRIVYIGTDNVNAGERAGEAMVRLLPKGGSVYAFVGTLSAGNARQRLDGFLKAISGHHVTLKTTYEDQTQRPLARSNVQNVLDSHPGDVQGLLGLYSYNAPAIAAALIAAHLQGKIKVVGFDLEPETQAAVKAGVIDATIVQKPYLFGSLSVKFLALAHEEGAERAKADWNRLHPDFPIVGDRIDTGVTAVTPAKIAPLLRQMKKWGVTAS